VKFKNKFNPGDKEEEDGVKIFWLLREEQTTMCEEYSPYDLHIYVLKHQHLRLTDLVMNKCKYMLI
jgi:hypothetical protein